MLDDFAARLEKGAQNLLANCAECLPGHKVLLVYETEDDGYFDPAVVEDIRRTAHKMGLVVEQHGVPLERDVTDPDAALCAKMSNADCTVFLARLGDQIRFRTKDASMRQVISYIFDRDMLASDFGTFEYRAFEMFKGLINDMIATTDRIHVTCPAGTDFYGSAAQFAGRLPDVTRKRFPVSVFAPVPAQGFRGRIAQTGFLTGTGSRYYLPYTCPLNETLFVDFDASYITGFNGTDQDVAAARAHYDFVGSTYGIDTYYVHSWHAGIHPGLSYFGPAAQNFERWGGCSFGNPKLLHFHTCGRTAPGEISLNIVDPTLHFDGVTVWDNGRLIPENVPGYAAFLDEFPGLDDLFANPQQDIGQIANGRLSYW